MPLGKPRLVRPEDHRQMAEPWDREAERLEHRNLPRRIREMVVAANDMRDAHEGVIHDHREVVRGIAVRAEDDQVVEYRIVELDAAFDQIVDNRLAGLRRLEPERRLTGRLANISLAAAAIVFLRQPLRNRLLAARVELIRRADTPVRVSSLEQLLRMVTIQVHTLSLAERPFIPIQADPPHAFDDRIDRLRRGPVLIGVLDAKDERAVLLPGQQPVEKCSPDTANVEVAGGARGEANASGGQCPSFTRFLFHAGISITTSFVPFGTHWQPRRDCSVMPGASSS